MSVVFTVALTLLVSYLLGCFNGSVMTSHFIIRDDVRQHGSGNAGLTNFYRTYGARYALCVIICDMGKTVLACLIGGYLMHWVVGDWTLGLLIAGIGCELGHMFPVFFGFKGGKGVSSTCGVMLMTFWWQALICYVITIALIAITKFVSLGSLALVVLFGILVTATNWGNWLVIAWVWVIAGLCIYRHHANIGRLIHGTERKIGQKA